MNVYRLTITFYALKSAMTHEYKAENERIAIMEALIDLDEKEMEKHIKQITVYRIG